MTDASARLSPFDEESAISSLFSILSRRQSAKEAGFEIEQLGLVSGNEWKILHSPSATKQITLIYKPRENEGRERKEHGREKDKMETYSKVKRVIEGRTRTTIVSARIDLQDGLLPIETRRRKEFLPMKGWPPRLERQQVRERGRERCAMECH